MQFFDRGESAVVWQGILRCFRRCGVDRRGNECHRLLILDDTPRVRFLTGVHQRITDTLFELLATGDNFDVEGIESTAFDFNPGVLMVVGTPHLGNGCHIFPSDLFDRRIKSGIQSKPRIIWTPSTGTGRKTCSHSPVAAEDSSNKQQPACRDNSRQMWGIP